MHMTPQEAEILCELLPGRIREVLEIGARAVVRVDLDETLHVVNVFVDGEPISEEQWRRLERDGAPVRRSPPVQQDDRTAPTVREGSG